MCCFYSLSEQPEYDYINVSHKVVGVRVIAGLKRPLCLPFKVAVTAVLCSVKAARNILINNVVLSGNLKEEVGSVDHRTTGSTVAFELKLKCCFGDLFFSNRLA